jgi:putative DNA primase/helicase
MSAPYKSPSPLALPVDLTATDQWVLWARESRDGKPTKVPYQTNGERAESNNPRTWAPYQVVLNVWREAPERYAGIGFVFGPDDPYAGIDLDNCLDDQGNIKPWAKPILDRFANTYIEISPSGRGVKIFLRARLDTTGRAAKYDDGRIEVYDRKRFFTVTGHRLNGVPLEIEDHQGDIPWLLGLISSNKVGARTGRKKADLKERKKILEGERYSYLQSVAAQFGVKGMSQEEIYPALSAIKQERCVPPKQDQVLRELVAWAVRLAPGSSKPGQTAPEFLNLLSFPLTDSGNAERMASLFGSDIRYCHEMRRFLVWDGCRWNPDNSRQVNYYAKETARLLFAQAGSLPEEQKQQLEYRQAVERHARKSESAKCRRDALECLSAEQTRIPIHEPQLDPDPLLLNCLTGTIELRTAELREHRQEDLISKLIPIEYDPRAECPIFMRFIHQIMGHMNPDAEPTEETLQLVRYLQQAFGCAATGKPEKVLFVFYGDGNNGKTTLVEIIRAALGDREYAGEVNIDSLMVRPKEAASSNAINSDLADLRGCRFVSSSEVEEGQRLSLSRVKYLTGLGQIKARRLGQDWITFKPTHKLFVDANHKPIISDPNDAIWNRVKCIPFEIRIPDHLIDTELPAKLRTELPGILRWIVEGAMRYLKEGIGEPPATVRTATAGYRQESDVLAEFLEDRCIVDLKDGNCWVAVAELWPTYFKWAESTGQKYPLPKSNFDERIKRMGCKQERPYRTPGRKGERVRAWMGIRLKTADERGTE